jgi:hypothetical protein
MFVFIFKIVVGLSLFSMVPASAVESIVPGLSDFHEATGVYMSPLIDQVKSVLFNG